MFKTLHILKRSLVVAVALIASLGMSAQTQITDEAGLKAIANDLSGSYVLANDITLSGEWTPLGTETTPFTGTFDGAGHAIKNLVITSGVDNVGLFSFTNNATLTNVLLPGVNVKGNKQAGALVGQAIGSKVSKVFVSGVVAGFDHVGGIIGDVRGTADGVITTVENCLSTAFANSSAYQAGVLVGWVNYGDLSYNVALGSAVAPGNGAGGITPIIDNGAAIIMNCVAAPALLYGAGNLENQYAHSICGFKNGESTTLTSEGNLSSTSTLLYEGGTKVEDFSVLNPELQGTPTAVEELKKAATYTGLGFDAAVWTLADGKFPILKGMSYPIDGDAVVVRTLPATCAQDGSYESSAQSALGRKVTIVSDQPSIVEVDGTTLKFKAVGTANVTYTTEGDEFAKGAKLVQVVTVSGQNYNITTAQDLLNIQNNLEGDYTLGADIDMTGVEFTPLGDFRGSLDGQGHVIKGLTFNDPNRDQTALFSTSHGATITKVGIEDANLVGNANVAAFVGRAYGGKISQCYVANSYIEGRDHVASFVGDLNHDGEGDTGLTIEDCLSDAKIKSRSYQASGIAGVANGGTMQRCLFSGTVDNPGGVAGLISLIDNNDWETFPTIAADNFSAPAHLFGGVSTDERMIHLAGRGATTTNNYALASTIISKNGGTFTAGDADAIAGADVDDATARTKAFYTDKLNWDFNNTWKFFDGAEGKMYPVLAWMKAPLKSEIFDLPKDVSLLYSDGTESISLATIHGSWGQVLNYTLTEGGDKAAYEESENKIFAGNADGEYGGSGDVVVKVSNADALASVLTPTGADIFSFFVGKSGDITKISTPQEFADIQRNLQGTYELANDIDMAGFDFKGIAEGEGGTPFSGTLYGNGHKVKNLMVTVSGTGVGVFGFTSGAKFSNIAFEDFTVNAPNSNHVGFIGRASSTKFEQVALTGKVYGNDHVAVLAGDGDGSIVNNSYVNGFVYGYSQVGGFFGCTLEGGATITNSYSNSGLTAYTRGWVGGFIGLIDKANSEVTIKNCVSIGDAVSNGDGSPHFAGPFVGGNGAGDKPNAKMFFSNNLANANAIMDAAGGQDWPSKNITAEGGDVQDALAVGVVALQDKAGYADLNWDWDNVWTFDTASGYLFPVLKSIGVVANGIKTVGTTVVTDADAPLYNLSGQRVNKSYKGIVVKKGKKYLNK